MDFGYFTLSDNHYESNTREANQFVADITAEALYADEIGMHSAWIGEHHFNSLGVLSLPRSRALLHRGAYQAHPPGAGGDGDAAASSDPGRRAVGDARPAQQRARRFRRRPRLRQPRVCAVQGVVRRQPGHLRGGAGARPHAVGGRGAHLPSRQALPVRRRADHAQAGAAAAARLCRLVLQAVDRARRAARLRPHRRAVRRRHELRRPASRWPISITRPARSTAPGRSG